LPAVSEIGLERVDRGVVEWDQIEVEHLVALLEQVGDTVASSLARATSEDDALAHGVRVKSWSEKRIGLRQELI
jgi:hypothetical protein